MNGIPVQVASSKVDTTDGVWSMEHAGGSMDYAGSFAMLIA